MVKYRIRKLGSNPSNSLGPLSSFGDSKEYFEGKPVKELTVGERFTLINSLGGIEISTSIVTEIGEGYFYTVYSKYSIEEVKDAE